MTVVGIDPGKSGALAVRVDKRMGVYKCPDTQVGMFVLLRDLHEAHPIDKAVLEKVHSMPGEGVSSVWSFSGNYHSWRMALVALSIPFEELAPQTWMKEFQGLPVFVTPEKESKKQKRDRLAEQKRIRKQAIYDIVQARYPKLKLFKYSADAVAIMSVGWDRTCA